MLNSVEEAIIIDFTNAFRSKISKCSSRASNSSKSVFNQEVQMNKQENVKFNETILEDEENKSKY